jgi:hypothetical protein
MMNKTMMENKLDESSNFKFLEDKTSEEDLLWVIQKGDTVTTFFMTMSEDKNQPGPIGEIILAPSRMHLYIYIICIIFMRVIAGGRNLLLKSWIQRDLSAFKGTTHWK